MALKSSTVTQIKNNLQTKPVDSSSTVKNDEKARRKAERKAQFEAERAAKLKQQPGNDSGKGNIIKSKAELRAERRVLQETQRAAKANAQISIQIQKNKVNTATLVVKETTNDLKPIEKVKKLSPGRKGKKDQLFGYLRQNKCDQVLLKTTFNLHPAVVRLGLQYSDGLISGSNARCIAFLLAMKQVIADYVTPSDREMCRDLSAKMDAQMNFLLKSRPVSMSVENANTFLKRQLAHVTETSDSEIKSMLLQAVSTYIKEEILIADKTIADFASEKIKDGDVILVFSHSSVVNTVLKRAFSAGVIFQVIIVEGLLKSEGIKTKRCLVRHGIECTYALICGISSAMEKASKVFLGAHALLYNGYVMSRVGTALVAVTAKAYNVPVLVCCESHKFTEKIQIDSLICNELTNPDDLIQIKTRSNWLPNLKNVRYLDYVYLMYDVMPRGLVTVVVTEFGLVPSTSVGAILKIKRKII